MVSPDKLLCSTVYVVNNKCTRIAQWNKTRKKTIKIINKGITQENKKEIKIDIKEIVTCPTWHRRCKILNKVNTNQVFNVQKSTFSLAKYNFIKNLVYSIINGL